MKISIFDKILILLVTILVITLLFPLQSKAISSILQSGDDFLTAGGTADNIDEAKLQSTSKKVYQALMVIATIVAVIIGAILGFQFITASVEGKAKVQEALVPYIAGCIIVFGAFFIWKIAINTGNSIERSTGVSGFDTQPGTSYDCPECGGELGAVPASVIVGGREWLCPNCNKYVKPWASSEQYGGAGGRF